jgi:hypothetical protein
MNHQNSNTGWMLKNFIYDSDVLLVVFTIAIHPRLETGELTGVRVLEGAIKPPNYQVQSSSI